MPVFLGRPRLPVVAGLSCIRKLSSQPPACFAFYQCHSHSPALPRNVCELHVSKNADCTGLAGSCSLGSDCCVQAALGIVTPNTEECTIATSAYYDKPYGQAASSTDASHGASHRVSHGASTRSVKAGAKGCADKACASGNVIQPRRSHLILNELLPTSTRHPNLLLGNFQRKYVITLRQMQGEPTFSVCCFSGCSLGQPRRLCPTIPQ